MNLHLWHWLLKDVRVTGRLNNALKVADRVICFNISQGINRMMTVLLAKEKGQKDKTPIM